MSNQTKQRSEDVQMAPETSGTRTAPVGNARKKVLYAASTQSHLVRFHQPYIDALKQTCDVLRMANGADVEFPIAFEKKMFCLANLRAIRQIRNILRKEKFDAVILNTSLAAFLIRAAMIGMRHRPRVLNIVHGYLFSDPPKDKKLPNGKRPHKSKKDCLMLLCEQILRRQTDEIAVMNAEDLEIVTRRKLCRGKVHFLRGMGFQFPEALPERAEDLRRSFAPGAEDVLLSFVGELSNRKNQMFLIRAVEELRREGLPVRLMLVGEGAEREALEQEILKRGLEQSVFLTGNREPVVPYLTITDLYVSASRIEGLPFNLMEAMACGLPVVVSDVKGQNDLLRDIPECLYPPEDMETFCAAVRRAVETRGSARLGAGACSYPQLKGYRLDAVLEENLNLMKGFLS